MRSLFRDVGMFIWVLPLLICADPTKVQEDATHTLWTKSGGIDWWDAKYYCQNVLGAPLAVPRNQAEQDKLDSWASGLNVWFGYQDYDQEGNWHAVDGIALNPADYTGNKLPWHPGEPNNSGDEDCVHKTTGAGGLWNDLPCNEAMLSHFLCGKDTKWRPVFKVMRGKSLPRDTDYPDLFVNGPSTPADEAAYLSTFDPSSPSDSVPYYRSSFLDKWNEQLGKGMFDRVKVVVYKSGNPVLYFVYSATSDLEAWHSQTHSIDSSFSDVKAFSHGEKQWAFQSVWYDRQFMVWAHAGGCDNDNAWMLATFHPVCTSWGGGAGEIADGNPTIWYSAARGTNRNEGMLRSNLKAAGQRGDTIVVFVGHTQGAQYEECKIEDHLLDWDAMFLGDDPLSDGESSVAVTRNTALTNQIHLDLKITAPYLMGSTYNSMKKLYDGKTPNGYLGVTYVLGTGADFESAGRFLKDATNCENRVSSDFDGKKYVQDFFDASTTPSDPSGLGTNAYLAYPPSNIWDIAMVDAYSEPCGDIEYTHTFSFEELRKCHGFAFRDTGTKLELEGAFYLAAVSPLPWIFKRSECLENDCGQYLTYTLQSHPVIIEFTKKREVVSTSEGIKIDLFSSHIVSATFDESDDTFRMDLITSVPNFMSLDVSTAAIVSPQESDLEGALNGNEDFLTGPLHISEESSGYPSGEACLITDQYRCFQKFAISAQVKDCTKARHFDGDYFFTADFTCKPGQDAVCDDYLSDETRKITLDTVKLEYTEGCDKSVYDVAWGGEIFFYADGTFTDPPLTTATYMKGDTVYTRVQVATVAEYSVVGMHIGAAYLCGSDNTKLPPEGCLAGVAKGIDTLVYDIINDPGLSYQLINGNNKDEFEDFSFVLPVVADNTFFVHVDCVLDIVSPTTRRLMQMPQRLLLTIDPSASAFQTYIGRGTIVNGQHNPLDIMNKWQWFNAYVMVGIFMALTLFGLSSLFMRKKKKTSKLSPANERMPLLHTAGSSYNTQ